MCYFEGHMVLLKHGFLGAGAGDALFDKLMASGHRRRSPADKVFFLFFFITLGPEMSDTKVCEP